jgi:hypothetical protein
LRGYGPLLCAATGFVLVLWLVPPRPATVGPAGGPGPVTQNQVATGGDRVKPCADGRATQVPGDPYAPPCLDWAGGDNGGETSRGVTGDTITISYRNSDDIASLQQGLQSADPSGAGAGLGVDRITATVAGLVDYFNRTFQFYGRHLRFVPFTGTGAALQELVGAGQQQSEADALKAMDEIGAFADVSGTPTQPYASALAARKVISLAAPSPSDQYLATRRPYVWSYLPSCTTTSRAAGEMLAAKLVAQPARFAGDPQMRTRPRKIAILSPEGQEYQNCTNASIGILRAAGADALSISYQLDFGNMAKAAENILNRLLADGITTVACSCDPLLPASLTRAATEARYRPEWVIMGAAMSDNNVLSRAYDQSQWAHAFGITVTGQPLPPTESPAYKAFRSVRPDDEPTSIADGIYYQLYLLALGIQMAGPQLTPESFERGMLAYPEHTGPGGTWKFEPGRFTPQRSASLLWWDAGATAADGGKGTYRYVDGPYRIGGTPEGFEKLFAP